jgi:hypothetical protein
MEHGSGFASAPVANKSKLFILIYETALNSESLSSAFIKLNLKGIGPT